MSDQIVKTVHDALVDIARSASFTPDALKQFSEALAEVKSLTNRVSILALENERLNRDKNSLEVALAIFKKRETDIESRELAVSKRENMASDLEKKTAVAEAKEQVRKEVFDTIFKNTVVRETIQRTASENQPGPHYGTLSRSGTDTVERSSE